MAQLWRCVVCSAFQSLLTRFSATTNQLARGPPTSTLPVSGPLSFAASIPPVSSSSTTAIPNVTAPALRNDGNVCFYKKTTYQDATNSNQRKPVVASAYLEHEDGTPFTDGERRSVYSTSRDAWNSLKQAGTVPDKLSSATSAQKNYYRYELGTKHPELLYAESYWKIDRVWSTQYNTWAKTHKKEKVKLEPLDHVKLEPESSKPSSSGSKRKHSNISGLDSASLKKAKHTQELPVRILIRLCRVADFVNRL